MAEWNIGDPNNKKGLAVQPEKAILVGLVIGTQRPEQATEYLDELQFLAETAGAITIERFTQKLTHPESRTYVGTGKLQEIAQYISDNPDVSLVIFDDDLTGKQTNVIEEALKRKILDRSTLILDIFASRAQTAQAKKQVELAQLQYLLPRLRGLWTHLERQRGGIGMRGPGEQEIETDRRIVRDKIAKLKKDLERIDQQNQTQRKNRGELVRVSLVGYTNVGKSSLMNVLGKADVFAENKLFATLDTTVRKVVLDNTPFLLSDTVGFIRKLPHHLVESFKSTLDEVRESDLLIHVVDLAHPNYHDHISVVTQTLHDINASNIPVIYVFNKIDLYRQKYFDEMLDRQTRSEIEQELAESLRKQYGNDTCILSATERTGIDHLRQQISQKIADLYAQRYPFNP